MMCEIVQRSGGGQFLTDLRDRRIGGVPTRPTDTRETAVAGVEVSDHLTMVAIFTQLETHFPVVSCGCHTPMLRSHDA